MPVESLLYDDDSASASNPGAPDNSRTFVPGPVTPHTAGLSPTPACADPFVHHVDEQPPIGGPDATHPASADLEPPISLLDRLNSDQGDSFLQVWHKLPTLLREISFDFHGPGWDADVIPQLGDTLIEFTDVSSTSPTEFGSCSLLPFEISVPPDSSQVTSRPYRVSPLVAKQKDTILDEYLAAGLMHHSTLPYAILVVIIPKKSGGIRLTINYKKLNNISILGQLPIPRIDEILDKLGTGRIFSLFDLVSSFHQITVHKDTIPLTAFCTPTRLFEWLVMPQGSSLAP